MLKYGPQEKPAGIRQNYDVEKKRQKIFAEIGSLTPEWKCFFEQPLFPRKERRYD
jgi:hypothetical protein